MKQTPNVRYLNRRQWLELMGGAFAASLAGGAAVGAGLFSSYTPAVVAGCVVSPAQTEGPYFVDEKLNRSDIRIGPSDGSVSLGVPLSLVLNVFKVTNNSCEPLPGATVDIWHCDAAGVYSDVADHTGDARGKKFLRGYQVTDADGKVEFQTIYPGWYHGRTVHIHYMVRTESTSGTAGGREFTSQLYFAESITDEVHSQAPYSEKGKRDMRNERDFIYKDGGAQAMMRLVKNEEGYVGTYNVGFQMT